MTTQKFTIHTKLNNEDIILHPKTEISQVEGFTQSVNGLIDTAIAGKANAADVYTKTAADNKFAEQSTTLAGYGITNAYTKTEVDNALSEIDVDIEDITSAEIASNWDNLTPANLAEYVTQEEMEDYVATVIATITNADQESY